MKSHRKPQLFPRREGFCRVCDGKIHRKDGRPSKATWHQICVDRYKKQAHPAETRKIVFDRDRGVCATCECYSVDWQADHIIPLIDGGGFGLENLQTLCVSCHKAKTSKENKARRRKS